MNINFNSCLSVILCWIIDLISYLFVFLICVILTKYFLLMG